MKIFYFTATGNSLEVAKAIGGELLSIPQVLRKKQTEFTDDAIGIVFPCYALGVPGPVKEFIKTTSLKADYIFGIMTYGNFEGGGVFHFNKLCKRNGIKLSYLNSILMVDNYLNFFAMEKQIESLPKKKVPENLSAISKDIDQRKQYIKSPNIFLKALTAATQLFFKFMPGNVDNRFSIEDSCNNCKVCEKVCPVNNIEVTEKPVFRHKCISCYACTHNCPQNAIRLKGERSKARFRNQNVSLEELIAANDQTHD
ncbi:MAG: EFR1 family ferrodoxin [Candidatus Rifleibacteriota bacterium]